MGLSRGRSLPPAPDAAADRRAKELMFRLKRLGVRGWPERMTLYTRGLPQGCRPCLRGQGSNLALTLKCNRDCFFCFNPRPRSAGMSVHGRKVSSPRQAALLLRRLGVRSVGISGGEPLLEWKRLLALLKELRRGATPKLRIDLYTNGDLLTLPRLRALRSAGVDGLRLNLAANGYQARPAALAREVFEDVETEIPVVPEHKGSVLKLMGELERLGCRHLILHELFCSSENAATLAGQGRLAKPGPRAKALTWSAVAGSEEAALELLADALRRRLKLSVYYCSCATQSWIAQKALARGSRVTD